MNTPRHIIVSAGLAALLFAACSGVAAADAVGGGSDQVDQRQPLGAGGSLNISDNLPGTVTVSAWDRSEVGVSGVSGCSRDGWEFGGTLAELPLTVKLPTHSRNVADCELRIRFPADAPLTLRTISADVSLSGVHGPLKIHQLGVAPELRNMDLRAPLKAQSPIQRYGRAVGLPGV